MNQCMKTEIAARDGDLRILLLLGIANWFLFVDHVPHNAVSSLTLRNFGFSGATDLFVFVGGYAAAIIYAKKMVERGSVVGATRIFKRLWQLYAAYVVLFVIYVDLIGYVAAQTAAPDIIAEFNIAGFIDHPIRTLIRGLLLQATPLNLDVLQLFIVLMAFLPIVLIGMLRWPTVTLAGSAALYVTARIFDRNLLSFPEGDWVFNPLSWQLLFVLGAWFALSGARQARLIRSMQGLPALRIAALLYLLFALVITSAGKLPALAEMVPDSLLSAFLPNDRENLAPYRVLHLLAMAFLFTLAVPRGWRGFRWPVLQPLIKCGEEWLAVFCAGVFLSFAAHFILITGPNSLAMQVLVSAAGILMMTAVAYYVSWSRRQDYKSALGARS
ncbi:OpgC domain-containing protein [Bradyrhizobium sp. Ash2021]|uniref:OpgC domain-containing protein n=1 Tax=Bradyrhizobium sp. Ash2021 TaxID=2954771 RepID=UPI002814EF8A|nr:OpgC domain-containing protein [Bradyrhizobium sp. Ash2021]WMT72830.1 OpgC domain-containing protein [Bradyrhizobium sp. Ash2021]